MSRRTLLITALILLSWTTLALACPSCKDSIPLSNADDATGPPKGINASVYLMLGTFLTVLTAVAWTLYRAVRTSSPRPAFPITKPS